MPFTLADNLQFYGLEMSLRNVLMIDMFRSNNRMVIFSKTEKKSYLRKHLRHQTFMTSTWKGMFTWGGLKICHMSPEFFVLKQKIYCSFLRMEWVCGVKLQPIQSLEAVVSSSIASHEPDTF